jgi:hypothetical protein
VEKAVSFAKRLKHIPSFFVGLVLQDQLRRAGLKYLVEIKEEV